MTKRIQSLLTALTLLLGCVGALAETAPAESAHKIETKIFPVYLSNGTELPGGMYLAPEDRVNIW